MIGYVKCFDSHKTISFVADDKELVKKYIETREKINGLIGKKFDSEPVYGDKYIKTKINSYNNIMNTNFHGKKVSKEGCSYKCLSLIVLDSVIKMDKKYYPQTLLENFVTDYLSSECDSEPDSKSDSEPDNKADE